MIKSVFILLGIILIVLWGWVLYELLHPMILNPGDITEEDIE